MNHSEEHYQRREKFLRDKVETKVKLERNEWIISKRDALNSFLGRDKLAELNAQRLPEHWPMKDGPMVVERYEEVDNLMDALEAINKFLIKNGKEPYDG